MSVFAPAMTVDDPRNLDAETQISADDILPANEETGLLQDSEAANYTTLPKSNGALSDEYSGGTPSETWWKTWLRRTMMFISIMILTFLAAMNMPLTTVIQSSVTSEFNHYDGAAWLTASFMIATSLSSPIAGRLCVIFGPLNFILFCAALQFVGTVATALSTSFFGFIACRVVAGIGAGAMMPSLLIMVLQIIDVKDRGFWVGLMNAGFTIGMSLGGILAGRAIDSELGWRAIFAIQSATILAAGVMTFLAAFHQTYGNEAESVEAPGSRHLVSITSQLRGVDFLGIFCLSPALSLLLLRLSLPDSHASIFMLSITFFILFVLIEQQAGANAIIPLNVLTSRLVFLSSFAVLALMTARWVVLFYSPIWTMAVILWTPMQAGTSLIPSSIGFATGGVCIGLLYMRRAKSFYGAGVICMAAFAATELGFAFGRVGTPAWVLALLSFANGWLCGAILNLTLSHALTGASNEELPVITGLLTTFRNFAGPLGTTIGGGAFSRSLTRTVTKGLQGIDDENRRKELIRRLLGSPALVRQLEGKEQEVARAAYASSICITFAVGTLVVILGTMALAGTWTRYKDAEFFDEGISVTTDEEVRVDSIDGVSRDEGENRTSGRRENC